MAVNQIALQALENLEAPEFNIASDASGYDKPKIQEKKEVKSSTGYTTAKPLVETDNYAKLQTETVSTPAPLYDKTDDLSFITGLQGLDLDWGNTTHRNRLLELQRNAEWNGKGSGISSAGAAGPAQFTLETWDEMKKLGVVPRNASRFDIRYAKKAQEFYMDSLYNSKAVQGAKTETDRVKRTLAAYNAGIGNLGNAITEAKRYKDEDNWFNYLPKQKETIPYMARILKNYKEKQPLFMKRKLGGILYKQ